MLNDRGSKTKLKPWQTAAASSGAATFFMPCSDDVTYMVLEWARRGPETMKNTGFPEDVYSLFAAGRQPDGGVRYQSLSDKLKAHRYMYNKFPSRCADNNGTSWTPPSMTDNRMFVDFKRAARSAQAAVTS